MSHENVKKFFEDLGVSPEMVCAENITNQGFYMFVPADELVANRPFLYLSGYAIKEFVEWQSEGDWEDFLDAARKDWADG